MKKVVTFVLVLSMILTLTSCDIFNYTLRKDSLEGYIAELEKYGSGSSSLELDHPKNLLPSQTFITDYQYVYGAFNLYEEGVRIKYTLPATSILVLRYEYQVYSNAKAYMLENIPAYNDIQYIYGDYIFYENANFVEGHDIGKDVYLFPKWFTMACYNDTKQELVFIGFCDDVGIDQKYYDDPQGNWVSFIDTYYGEYYDFSE